MAKKPNYRRGGARGGFRGSSGLPPSFSSGFAFPAPPIRTIYDYTLDKNNLAGTKNNMDTVFEKEILDRAANLTPSADVRKQVETYTKKVLGALEKEKLEKTMEDIRIEQIMQVGSFVNNTCTHSSDKSDIVVQLNILPSFETVTTVGQKIVEIIKTANPREVAMSLPTEYGCVIIGHSVHVRILVTIIPSEASNLEPGLHLESQQMMINFFAVRHTNWFEELKTSMPADFLLEYQALIKVLKDARSRFHGLSGLSIWALQYLAFYCLSNGPNRQKACLGTAFRRFFELIASGMFLPKAPTLIDPTTPLYRIGFDLTLPEMDALCMAAQTIIRTFATGNDGFRAVLGTHGSAADLTQTSTRWKDIEIHPSLPVYRDGCMNVFPAVPDFVAAPNDQFTTPASQFMAPEFMNTDDQFASPNDVYVG